MGTMAAALWDILAKAANLAQMSGLHAVMLVAVCATLLRIPQSKRECAELERCARRLRALLQWPATGCDGVTVALLCSDMGGPVSKAPFDAAGLVDTYKKSTLWCRVRSGRSMTSKLRDMQDVVNSYCGLVLFINAHLLIQATHHPTSDTTTAIHEVNEPSQNPTSSVQAVTSCPSTTGGADIRKANDIGRDSIGGLTGNTDPTGCERHVPDIVVFHA